MTVPVVQALGTPNHGTTGPVTYALPAHQAGDLLYLAVECGQTTGVPIPPSGWAHVTNSPRAQGSNVHAVNLMWLRAASSSETDPVVPAQANHQAGFTFVVRGGLGSGNPEDTGAAGVNSNLSTSLSVALGSTTAADCLIVFIGGSAADDTADQYGSFTNASLTSVTKQTFAGTTDGNGGSVDLITGSKATAGSAGTFAATQTTSTQWAGLGIAIKPAAGTTPVSTTRATTWNVKTAVSASRATTWDTLAPVSAARATTWDALAPVSAARATSWDVLGALTATRATSWDVLAGVSTSKATTWRVLARTSGTRATTWDVLASLSTTRTTIWRVLAQVAGTRATTWNVASTLTQVSTTRATTWRVIARTSTTRSTTWDVLARISAAARVTSWNTKARTSGARTTTWDVLAQTSTARATTWNVKTAAAAAKATSWRVLERIATDRVATWNVLAIINPTLDLDLTARLDPRPWTGTLHRSTYAGRLAAPTITGRIP